jgi:hypothetical protein
MATSTVGDVLVETLIKRNVDTVFGLPGGGINGIIEALRARQDRMVSFGSAMKNLLPSMPAVMPNGPESLASVSRRLVPAAFTSSTAFMMPSSMVSRCWLIELHILLSVSVDEIVKLQTRNCYTRGAADKAFAAPCTPSLLL